jgi:hypothetical protein
MEVNKLYKLRQLEEEKGKLNQIIPDQILDTQALKTWLQKKECGK